jgi:hypothetical protein
MSVSDWYYTFPQVMFTMDSFEPYAISGWMSIAEDEAYTNFQYCKLEGQDYNNDGMPRSFKVSDPYGMCDIAEYYPTANVMFEGGEPKGITGPDSMNYIFYTEDELDEALYGEDFVMYLLPLDKKDYNGEVTLTIEYTADDAWSAIYRDADNTCYLDSDGGDDFTVSGCPDWDPYGTNVEIEDYFTGHGGILYDYYLDKKSYE